jgi:hypothetical protein
VNRGTEQLRLPQHGMEPGLAAVGPGHEMHWPRVEGLHEGEEIRDMRFALKAFRVIRSGRGAEVALSIGHEAAIFSDAGPVGLPDA